MKNNKFFSLASLLIIAVLCTYCGTEKAPDFAYKTFKNDPLGVRIYTLNNGLKVYLSVNKDEPRIKTHVAVKTGSINDPADNTGLAHYLEHMLFKGNSQLGSANWEEEKKVLQQISDKFEEHKKTDLADQKALIYKQIDSLSQIAAKYVVPNEFDKLSTSLGAKGVNAYTSNDETVYTMDIPSNEVNKWLMLESTRFKELVLRLFHTELETVYEEYNMRYADDDFGKTRLRLGQMLYGDHPYGSRPTIGLAEHLKNPSMEKIHEYFNTYYVPNNMAIVMAGDLDPDKTISLINQYFGGFTSKEIPVQAKIMPPKIEKPLIDTVYGPKSAFMVMNYRFNGANTEDAYKLDLISELLSNTGETGLLDLNLTQKQKVLYTGCAYQNSKEYSELILYAYPKAGQSLPEVETLINEQLTKIKNGEFEDWMLESILKNYKLHELKMLESNDDRVSKMTYAFLYDNSWENEMDYLNKLQKITKADIQAFAKEKIGDNYALIRKLQGEDLNKVKVDKPSITAIDIARGGQSTFAAQFDSLPSDRLTPEFVDYSSGIQSKDINENVVLSYIPNTTNELFQLNYIFDFGSDSDPLIEMAFNYLQYLGTDSLSAAQIKQEFYKIAVSYSFNKQPDGLRISLSGLNESMPKAIQLIEHLMLRVKDDAAILENMVGDILQSRIVNKSDKSTILNSGLLNFAIYGPNSRFRNLLKADELKKIKGEQLSTRIGQLLQYPHRFFYYGPSSIEEALSIVEKNHTLYDQYLPIPKAKEYVELDQNENQILFSSYDMEQAEMLFISKDQAFNLKDLAGIMVFNQYFGVGMNSIVFQEIREARALAYRANAYMTTPSKKEENHYMRAYIGTQSDKLPSALETLFDLMKNLPVDSAAFDRAKVAVLKKMETERINKSGLFWSLEANKKLGINYDYRKEVYQQIQQMNFGDMMRFFDQRVKTGNYTLAIIGDKQKINFNQLSPYGKVKTLSLEELFGY